MPILTHFASTASLARRNSQAEKTGNAMGNSSTTLAETNDIMLPRPPPQAHVPDSAKQASSSSAAPDAVCGICWEEFKPTSAPCAAHPFCPACLRDYAHTALEDRSLFPLRCPAPECEGLITADVVRTLGLLDGDEMIRKFERFDSESRMRSLGYCANPYCGEAMECAGLTGAGQRMVECTKCGMPTCLECRAPWHVGMECEEYQSLMEEEAMGKEEDAMEQLSLAMQWKKCPMCKARVELHEGCNHIRCVCGNDFCFVCGQTWRPGAVNCETGCSLFRRNANDRYENWEELDPLLRGASRFLDSIFQQIARVF